MGGEHSTHYLSTSLKYPKHARQRTSHTLDVRYCNPSKELSDPRENTDAIANDLSQDEEIASRSIGIAIVKSQTVNYYAEMKRLAQQNVADDT